MRKIYFLISTFFVFLVVNFMTNTISSLTLYNIASYETEIINSEKYLSLSYENGKFYSWNQSDNNEQHIVGIFIENNQSYLIDNYGVFWNLEYEILNFFRLTNDLSIIQFVYLQDENKIEYFHHYFFVNLNENNIVINYNPISSKNFNFVWLNEEYIVAFGIGLELIKISDQSVTTLIPDYEKGLFLTYFYRINENSGVFIAGDQYFYLLKDITGNLIQNKIPFKAPIKTGKNLVVFDENNLIVRDEKNFLYLINIEEDISINKFNKISNVKNFAFILDHETFILNVLLNNSTFEYGKPYLVKINDLNNLISIDNMNNVNNLMFINQNQGILIDKNLVASSFSYQSNDDSFIFSDFGMLDDFQFINSNLFFGSLKSKNFLLSLTTNQVWLAKNSVHFTSNYQNNFLNNMISNENTEINYQNTYFSRNSSTISITNQNLDEVVITSENGKRTLKPRKNNITYDFLDVAKYQVDIVFFDNTLKYQVVVTDFINQNLIDISGSNIISYVGYTKNNLFDIKSIDKEDYFTVSYDLQYLQYVKLFTYDDAKNMVIKNISFLKTNTEIQFNPDTENILFGLQLVDVFNQVNWVYLGFNTNDDRVMINFWDTDVGKDLMLEAKKRKYLEKDLRNMNSYQIQDLIKVSDNWKTLTNQGKIIIITIVSFFFLAILISLYAIIYNIFLNKRIIIAQFEHNKLFKNFLDL